MLKNILLWRYGRSTWQYDVLSVLILAFVFLTPKSWFDGSEPRYREAHRNGLTSVTLSVSPGSPFDISELERRAQSLTGQQARIVETRPVRDAEGRVVAFEVDLK